MQAPESSSGPCGGSGSGSKPFLRRGAGWEARMAAAREGRRYVPKGGPVKDYSKEDEVPVSRKRTAASRGGSRVQSSRSPSKPRPTAGAGGGSARVQAGKQPLPQRQQAARPQPTAAAQSTLPAAAASRQHAAAAPPAASSDWARRLLRGRPAGEAQQPPATQVQQHPQQQQHEWEARQAEEDVALEEFEALESQVLREVGNSRPLAALASPARKKAQAGSGPVRQGRSDGGVCAPPAAGGVVQGEELAQEEDEDDEDDDVFQSDGEEHVGSILGEGSAAQAAAAGISHPLARQVSAMAPLQRAPGSALPQPPQVYQEDAEEEGQEAEMHAESSFVHDLPPPPTSGLVQKFFSRPPHPATSGRSIQQQQRQQRQQHPPSEASAAELEAVEQLQAGVVRLHEERAQVARLRLELQETAARLEQEQAAFEKRKLEEAARFEAERGEELRKLQRDRRVLEKQSRAILKMPTKQSKEEVAAVEALLAEERRCGRAREARHKLELERLRQQLREAQDSNGELRGQVQYLEAQRLAQSWGGAGTEPAALKPVQPVAVAAAELHAAGGGRRGSAGGSSVPTALDAARSAAGRRGQAGGLPAVKVERGWGGGSSSGRLGGMRVATSAEAAPTGPQQQELLRACWEDAAGEEEGEAEADEQLIADVELQSDEEVVVCEEQQEEQAAGSPPLNSMLDRAPSGVAAAQPSDGQQQPAAKAGAGAPQEAPIDAMSKANSALARFNQLHSSLAQHEGLQGHLGSRSGSLQASPLPLAALQPASNSAPAAKDDLRRLGRSLLAAAGPAASIADLAAQLAAPAHPAPAPGDPSDAVVSELQHPDGRWERLFASGLREQRFANGSCKLQLPVGSGGASGSASLTRFANSDAKKALPCGTVEYFYAEVNSWQVTHPTGVEVYFFPSGQVEAHHPGGIKEILFADGTVRKALPDGRELAVSAAHLSREIQLPQPRAELW